MLKTLTKIIGSGASLVVLSAVMLAAFGVLFYADQAVKTTQARLNSLTINAERILTADLNSTTAVRLAASLQSDRYLVNYQDYQDTKYALLDEISAFEKNAKVEEYLGRMEDVQADIEDAEAEAVSLIDEGNWEEALERVTEPAFARQKGIYRANLSSALREMILDSEQQAAQAGALYQAMQIGAMAAFAVLALIGFVYSREMRRLLRRRSELADRLEDANENLEQRVQERTAELRENQALFKTMLDNMPAVVFLKGADGRFQLVNRRYEDIYGLTLDEVRGRTLHDLYPKDLAERLAAIDRQVISSGEVSTTEHVQSVDGDEIVLSSVMFPIFDATGTVTGYGGVEVDITERKQAEKRLSEKEAQLRTALTNMSDGIFVLDADLNYSLFNDRYLELVELPESVIGAGKPVGGAIEAHAARGDYGPGEPADLVGARLERLGNSDAVQSEMTISQGKRVLSLRKAALDDGGAVVVLSDITESKTAERELQQSYNVIATSIDYASHIQRSVLPDETFFSILSDYFVLWEPRDVVGGDLYWCKIWGDGLLLLLGDCTGHGVPGAFMTLIATGALDNALVDVPYGHVGHLIQRIHQIMQITLGQHGEKGASDDGMELGAVYLAADADEIVFSGARFPLYLIEDGHVSVIKGTKSGIGYRGISHTQDFEEHRIINLETKTFYISTDGLTDQIGGKNRRMFGRRRFSELLSEIADLPMAEQKQRIRDSLADYQGDEPRRDDVSIIGFRV